ncbi:DUF975 domain-containing protein [Okeanomitos corallinicola TIOX110]|uniref:DUF975 domain-containing protein n=1 Tax=Okeanomitos corallinicola TIOX110 TaxID=3133117 RepID=A0ABZ2URH3_9CYAN
MSDNFSVTSNAEPLSMGNVVSAGVRLYRSHLKEYFLLALKAYLWVLVPVYGWAKCYALSALISRLAFGDLVNQPESIRDGERVVNSRLWQFLGTMLLMSLIGGGIGLGFMIVFGILLAIIGAVLGVQGGGFGNIAIFSLIAILVTLVGFVIFAWVLTRFYLVDLPLAIEENCDATQTIKRSIDLTKGYVGRIFLISFVAILITLPLQILLQILTSVIQLVFTPLLADGNAFASLIFFVLVIGIVIGSNAVILPFFQTLKAVIYYDLRSRREGLGLQLRDREV